MGHVVLGLWASDDLGRVVPSALSVSLRRCLARLAANRDLKRRLLPPRARQQWAGSSEAGHFPRTPCCGFRRRIVERIFAPRYGTKRGGHALPASRKCRLISRAVVATVAQEDYMKRIRGNGGSRTRLAARGNSHLRPVRQPRACRRRRSGFRVPGPGESVSVRLASRKAAPY